MQANTHRSACRRGATCRRGAMLILVVAMLIVVMVMAAFSVNLAYMQLVRTQLRTATDAAARSATEALVRAQDITVARNAALAAANANDVGMSTLQLAEGDIVFGSAFPNGSGQFMFAPGASPTNSVKVSGRLGTTPLLFGGTLCTGPFSPEMTSTSSGFVRDVAIVVDRSGSMLGDKFSNLQTATAAFLAVLDATSADERVSLASYSDTASKDAFMTSSMSTIQSAMDGLVASGWTAIGDGLQIGTDSLVSDPNSRLFAAKAIVLMTDGIENRGTPVMNVVPTVAARGHVIHTITFGAGADIVLMQNVAAATGGTHQHADDGGDLVAAFRKIAESLAVMLIE